EVARRRRITLSYPAGLLEAARGGRDSIGSPRSVAPPRRIDAPERVACDRPWKEIFVNQDGRIVPCCCGPGVGPTVGTLDDGIENAWNSERMREVRHALVSDGFDAACRCGANMAVRGRHSMPGHFSTRYRDDR